MRTKTGQRGAFLVLCLIGLAGMLTGCAGKSVSAVREETEAQTEQLTYPVVIRAGYTESEDTPCDVVLQDMKETVEERTGGAVQIALYPAGELGTDTDLLSDMRSGDVDMVVSSAGNYALYATRVGVSSLPYLFESFQQAWDFIDSDMMREVSGDLELFNMHLLSWLDNGFRCVTTSESAGPVRAVEDMSGLKIRTPENQIIMETLSELGAVPVSYPSVSLKEALEVGIFNAQENSIPAIFNSALYEQQKYLSVTNHSYDAMPLTIRADLWAQLKPEYRTVLEEAALAAQKRDRELVKKQSNDYVDLLRFRGMVVNYPDMEPFREATQDVLHVFENVYGEKLLGYIRENYQ